MLFVKSMIKYSHIIRDSIPGPTGFPFGRAVSYSHIEIYAKYVYLPVTAFIYFNTDLDENYKPLLAVFATVEHAMGQSPTEKRRISSINCLTDPDNDAKLRKLDGRPV